MTWITLSRPATSCPPDSPGNARICAGLAGRRICPCRAPREFRIYPAHGSPGGREFTCTLNPRRPRNLLIEHLTVPVPEAWPAGTLPRDGERGAGFAAGGAADGLPPGVALAGFASDAWITGLGRITDDQLIGVLRAWRRLTSWTAAGELAAVAELNRRRIDEVAAGADPHLAEHVGDELAVSLTLTARGADQLLDFAARL